MVETINGRVKEKNGSCFFGGSHIDRQMRNTNRSRTNFKQLLRCRRPGYPDVVPPTINRYRPRNGQVAHLIMNHTRWELQFSTNSFCRSYRLLDGSGIIVNPIAHGPEILHIEACGSGT